MGFEDVEIAAGKKKSVCEKGDFFSTGSLWLIYGERLMIVCQ